MAIKKPLVLTNGQLEQLQNTDIPSLGAAGKHRIIVSGSTTIAAGATVSLTTSRRTVGEMIQVNSFITNNVAGAGWSNDLSINGSTDNLIFFFQRTANANEFTLRAKNNGSSSRTVEWMVYGITP